MKGLISPAGRGGGRGERSRPALAVGLLALMLFAGEAAAEDRTPTQAQAGLDLAQTAARIWSPDAYLIYVENDEILDSHGAALRWGYLYYSPGLKKSRVYSVRAGKIVVAEDLEMKLEAPPVAARWIDSGAALKAAEDAGAYQFCFDHSGRLNTMALLRGAFQEGDPDRTTWMLVYTAPNVPALFVVVDATDGRVCRTWRG